MKQKSIFEDYEITENGDVYSTKLHRGSRKRRQLKPCTDRGGYRCVTLFTTGKRMRIYIHRLVAMQYLPPQPSLGHEIRHLDGNKLNNHFSNLQWGLHSENMADSIRHGTLARGERHGSSKLAEDQVRRIKFLVGKVERGYWVQLAQSLGVHNTTISYIVCNRSWRWIK